jgi:arginine repressor
MSNRTQNPRKEKYRLNIGKTIRVSSKDAGLSPATVSRTISDMRPYKLVDENSHITYQVSVLDPYHLSP